MGEQADYNGWWALLLFTLMTQEAPQLPKFKKVTQFECEGCGRVYHASSWSGYPPSYCSSCGGRVVENTFTVENLEAEAWEHMKELRGKLGLGA